MAILKSSVLGMFSGRIGSKVYYVRNGKQMMRDLPDPLVPKKPPTAAQIEQREKFKSLQEFLTPFSPVLEIGFKNPPRQFTPQSKAFSVNFPKIFKGTDPGLKVSSADLQLSDGYAAQLSNLQLEDKGDGLFGLSWNEYKDRIGRYNSVALVLYDDVQHKVFYALNLATVSRQEAEFQLNEISGHRVHVYVFTVGPQLVPKSPNSRSQYLGVLF